MNLRGFISPLLSGEMNPLTVHLEMKLLIIPNTIRENINLTLFRKVGTDHSNDINLNYMSRQYATSFLTAYRQHLILNIISSRYSMLYLFINT